MFSEADLEKFSKSGFIIVRNLFSEGEVKALRSYAENSETFKKSTFSKGDGEGGSIDLALWNNVDDSLFGIDPTYSGSNATISSGANFLGRNLTTDFGMFDQSTYTWTLLSKRVNGTSVDTINFFVGQEPTTEAPTSQPTKKKCKLWNKGCD